MLAAQLDRLDRILRMTACVMSLSASRMQFASDLGASLDALSVVELSCC